MTANDLPLTCPCHKKSALLEDSGALVCTAPNCVHSHKEHAFAMIDGIPVIISEENCDTVCSAANVTSYLPRAPSRLSTVKRVLLGRSETTRINCETFVRQLKAKSDAPKVLVIGSGEKGSQTQSLWDDEAITIHGVDVYASPSVDAVCDGHYLPLASDYYDGVWIQAVLEHVVDPPVVVSEIHRVLKANGLVYAETPFMQQVHEGAYDFTRYTVLGHRYLFRDFTLIEMGGLRGTEVVLQWSFRYFVWAVTRSQKVGALVSLVSGVLLRPFKRLTSAQSLHDGPSGVYFLGARSDKTEVTHKELLAHYKGNF